MIDVFKRAAEIAAQADRAHERKADSTYNTNASTDEVTAWAAKGGASKASNDDDDEPVSAEVAGKMLADTVHLPDDHPDKIKARKAWDSRTTEDSIGSSVRGDDHGARVARTDVGRSLIPANVLALCPAGRHVVRCDGGYSFVSDSDPSDAWMVGEL